MIWGVGGLVLKAFFTSSIVIFPPLPLSIILVSTKMDLKIQLIIITTSRVSHLAYFNYYEILKVSLRGFR